ncbi:MAG: hypothetical protein RSE00_05640 [Clostridia bacterium]
MKKQKGWIVKIAMATLVVLASAVCGFILNPILGVLCVMPTMYLLYAYFNAQNTNSSETKQIAKDISKSKEMSSAFKKASNGVNIDSIAEEELINAIAYAIATKYLPLEVFEIPDLNYYLRKEVFSNNSQISRYQISAVLKERLISQIMKMFCESCHSYEWQIIK